MMNEFNDQMLQAESERLQKISSEVSATLSEPGTAEGLQESVIRVAAQIEKMYESGQKKDFVFIVGGKSRRLTEALLDGAAEHLPPDHPAIQAIKERVRLDDSQNKNMYGESTSKQVGERKVQVPPLIALLGKLGNRQLVVCDDAMETGRKVFHTLSVLQEKGINARYIVFSGPSEFSAGTDYLRPDNWEMFKDRVIVGTNNSNAAKVIRGISGLLSSYANIRLNKNVHVWGQSIPATIDTVEQMHGAALRSSSKLLTQLKSLIDIPNS